MKRAYHWLVYYTDGSLKVEHQTREGVLRLLIRFDNITHVVRMTYDIIFNPLKELI